MKRALWLAIATLTAAILFYVSRFWDFRLWPRDGLFGIEALRPQGGLVAQWLRGTDLAPFELLIWAIGAFLILTLLQKLYDLLNPPPE
ncbi:hypothetical protein [Tateyamaria omphalii]|uniref:Uncharacterized protein n=1 Tax=Tateyamaria omphalii TaxID=299262 RepID=A0A1P8MUY9_9RHOB|nr:hypothetical protein [Tateyamaria omphalii]APX11875.1 hypothetical protein BWR18_09425 [Tateyamaria omphalii]